MISKVMIVPYFGDFPPWMDHWFANTERMKDHGYDFLHDDDEAAFQDRVREILGIEPPPMAGTGNIWDFRPALGMLYADEIHDFDFWGHTDFDCVYGRVENWMTDELLSSLDIFSNHTDYICGAWSLYRNDPYVNALFGEAGEWRQRMSDPTPSGWAETGFTNIVDLVHSEGLLRRRYSVFQTKDWNSFDTLRLHSDGRLMEGDDEVMMAHFRRAVGVDGKKIYPKGCVL